MSSLIARRSQVAQVAALAVLAALAALWSRDAQAHGKPVFPSQDVVAWSSDGRSCLLREKSTPAVVYRLVSLRSPNSSRKFVLSDNSHAKAHDHEKTQEDKHAVARDRVSAARCRSRLASLSRLARRLGFKGVKVHPRRCRLTPRAGLVTAPSPAVVYWKSIYKGGRRAGMELGHLRALAFDGRVTLLVDNKIHYRGEQEVQHDSPRRAPQGGMPLRNVRAVISPSGHLLLLFGSPSISFEWLEVILGSDSGKPEDLKPLAVP